MPLYFVQEIEGYTLGSYYKEVIRNSFHLQ
jgi:hypothetical protein